VGANYGGVLINENKGGKDLKFGYIWPASYDTETNRGI